MLIRTANRSNQSELMDDLTMQGNLLRDTLNKIATINKRLGGNNVTLNGLKQLLKTTDKNKVIKIVDLGCGNGDMLREIANYGRKSNQKFELSGIDANEFTISYANELSKEYQEINFKRIDVFSEEFDLLEYDIAIATLFLHHFKEEEIIILLKKLNAKASIGVLINDLHRHKLAYYLFKIVSFFINNSMVQHDGLVSILRGFKRKELEQLTKKLKFKNTIRWKWAFRYQLIIQK